VRRRREWWRWAGLVVRLGLGAVWLFAGVTKLSDAAASVRAVRAYELLPEVVVPAVGFALPVLEVGVGLLLVAGLGTRVAATLSTVLLAAFVAGIASAWARGLQIECGCFGGGGFAADATARYPVDIARDAGLLVLSAALAVRPRTPWALDNRLMPEEGDRWRD